MCREACMYTKAVLTGSRPKDCRKTDPPVADFLAYKLGQGM